jgi:hypothetical protein
MPQFCLTFANYNDKRTALSSLLVKSFGSISCRKTMNRMRTNGNASAVFLKYLRILIKKNGSMNYIMHMLSAKYT